MGGVLNKMRSRLGVSFFLVLALLGGPAMVAATAQGAGQADVVSEPITILLMVSDARSQGDVPAGQEAAHIEAGATDVMVVVHLNPDQQACRALNLLPNTRVQIEGVGNTRLNQAMSQGGVAQTTTTVEEYLGIEIDHFGVIDLDGVIMAIDAVGGITINNPVAFSVGGNDFPAGEITLSGEQAVLYAAAGGQQDTQGRLAQQKALVEGLIDSVGGMNPAGGIPAAMQGAVANIQDHILTDITLETALAVANAYSSCVPDEETVETIPFTEEGPMLDDATQQEQVSGATDPVNVQAHADWLINGTALP